MKRGRQKPEEGPISIDDTENRTENGNYSNKKSDHRFLVEFVQSDVHVVHNKKKPLERIGI